MNRLDEGVADLRHCGEGDRLSRQGIDRESHTVPRRPDRRVLTVDRDIEI